jgi:hypothetical protein
MNNLQENPITNILKYYKQTGLLKIAIAEGIPHACFTPSSDVEQVKSVIDKAIKMKQVVFSSYDSENAEWYISEIRNYDFYYLVGLDKERIWQSIMSNSNIHFSKNNK